MYSIDLTYNYFLTLEESPDCASATPWIRESKISRMGPEAILENQIKEEQMDITPPQPQTQRRFLSDKFLWNPFRDPLYWNTEEMDKPLSENILEKELTEDAGPDLKTKLQYEPESAASPDEIPDEEPPKRDDWFTVEFQYNPEGLLDAIVGEIPVQSKMFSS
jgi:hypothetical protein